MATDYYTLNIVSATYGQWDVTQAARDIYIRNANTTQNSWTLTPPNGMFGGDPIPMSVKVFVCPWRVLLTNGQNSALYTTVIKEGTAGTINYDGTKLAPF